MMLDLKCSFSKSQAFAVLVLAANADFASQYGQIISIAKKIIDRLPSNAIEKIFILGSSESYSPNTFFSNAEKYLAKNQSRLSFVAPIMDALSASVDVGKPRLIIIGPNDDGVFDKEDWEQFAKFTILPAKLGGDEEIENIVSDLTKNPKAIRILCSNGWLPYDWDNKDYVWDTSKNCLALNVDENQEQMEYDITLRGMSAGKEKISVKIEYEDGETQEIWLSPMENTRYGKTENMEKWDSLSEIDQAVFEKASVGLDFQCPHCSRTHKPSMIWCDKKTSDDGGFGISQCCCVSALSATEKGNLLYLVKTKDGKVKYSLEKALKVSECDILLGKKIYHYNFSSQRWVASDLSEKYHRISDDSWGVALW